MEKRETFCLAPGPAMGGQPFRGLLQLERRPARSLLDGVGDRAVKRGPAIGIQAVIQGVADERLVEALPGPVVVDDASLQDLFQGDERVVSAEARRGEHHLQLEAPPHHRARLQQRDGAAPQPRDPLAHRSARILRNLDVSGLLEGPGQHVMHAWPSIGSGWSLIENILWPAFAQATASPSVTTGDVSLSSA